MVGFVDLLVTEIEMVGRSQPEQEPVLTGTSLNWNWPELKMEKKIGELHLI